MEQDALARCHPAVALAYFAVAIAFAAVVQHPAYLAAGLLAGAGYLTLLRGREALPFLAGTSVMFVLVAAVNPLFNTRGSHVLFELLGRPYTLEALCHGAAVAAMLAAMLVWFACYSQVVTADKLTCLFGNLAPALSLLLVMVLRAVPDLARKAGEIATARRCVGLAPGAGGRETPRTRLHAATGVLSALVDHALEGSVCTANSMQARGYGAGRRTTYQLHRWCARDRALLAAQGALLLAALLAGVPEARYTPVLSVGALSWGFVAYCGYLAVPFALRAKEALQWRRSSSSM